MTEPIAATMRGRVTEIFSSFQGEGIRVGDRMVFLRLAGCPWRCRYCDTPGSLPMNSGEEMSAPEAVKRVRALLEERPHAAVSFTGGEPLLQTDFLEVLLASVKAMETPTYLETAGTHPELLKRVIGLVDQVAMDVKLPSVIGREFWAEHEAFLQAAAGKAVIKIVVTEDSVEEELERALRVALSVDPVPVVVLQPVTSIQDLSQRLAGSAGAEKKALLSPPSPARLVALWEWARRKLPDVRIVPQMHPIWGLP